MNVKALPSPSRLSTQRRPPCSSTIRFESVSPSPVPSEPAEWPLRPCSNDSKIAPCRLGVADPRLLDPRFRRPHAEHVPSPSLRGRELHGVRQQIERDLLQPQRIRDDGIDVGIDPDLERETMLTRALADHRNTLLERVAHRRVAQLELHLPRLDLRQVEDVVEQLQQVPPRAADVLEVALLLLVQLAEQTVEEASEKPMTAVSGVRNSWDMLARNSTCDGLRSLARSFFARAPDKAGRSVWRARGLARERLEQIDDLRVEVSGRASTDDERTENPTFT